ncbi:hypothetical protein BH23BAC4_BH23BAC4_07490 [soil metagenome]
MSSLITADHIASSTGPCKLQAEVHLSPYIVAEEGYCLVTRALQTKEVYNEIEGADGVFRTIKKGDILVGALGERQALKGYSGRIPRQIKPGDVLHVLNMGGILGRCASDHPDLGPALAVEVLGAAMHGDDLRHARIQDHAIESCEHISESAPLVMVSGTAMNTGKTYAASELVAGLTRRGFRVAAAKLTGASLMRDVRAMAANGAVCTATFTEAGVVASTGRDMVPIAKGLVAHLNKCAPDVIVLELGDGIIGPYGVDAILQDMELQRLTAAHILAATDLAGAWAGDQLFRKRYRAMLAAVVGPATDTEVGRRYLQNVLGVMGINARTEAERLAALIASRVQRFELPLGDGYASTSQPAISDVHWESAR